MSDIPQSLIYIASICYEAVRAFNRSFCQDYSQIDWSKYPGESSFYILGMTFFHLYDQIPHYDVWIDHFKNEGWSYSKVFNPILQTSPLIKPWVELDYYEQKRYHLIAAIYKELKYN
jgi:hypothetical protein